MTEPADPFTDDNAFLAAFEDGSMTKEAWTHRGHLRMAYLMTSRFPFEEAVSRTRTGLKQLLLSFGIEDELERGYHETLTVAWLRIVDAMRRRHGVSGTSEEFCEAQPQLGNRLLLRLYYTRDRILTWEAKREFVEPDIAPLPS